MYIFYFQDVKHLMHSFSSRSNIKYQFQDIFYPVGFKKYQKQKYTNRSF